MKGWTRRRTRRDFVGEARFPLLRGTLSSFAAIAFFLLTREGEKGRERSATRETRELGSSTPSWNLSTQLLVILPCLIEVEKIYKTNGSKIAVVMMFLMKFSKKFINFCRVFGRRNGARRRSTMSYRVLYSEVNSVNRFKLFIL